MKHPRSIVQPRHFSPGPSDSGRRIDHTSYDGSGLVCDDGNQRNEGRRDDRGPGRDIAAGKYTRSSS